MDTLDLVPFEGTQLQRVEDFDASKFHIKELRIKDLHKNLCKKPYFHVRLDSEKRTTSVAEQAEPNVEQHRSSIVTSDAEYETCEEDGVASIPQDPILPSLSEKIRREEFPEEEPEPAHRQSKRKTRLPGKFRHDDSIDSDFSERYVKHYRRAVPKSKVKLSRLKENPQPVQTQFFEVPIEAHEENVLQGDASGAPSGGERIGLGSSKIADSDPCTPSDRKAPTKPLKQIYHAPSSGQSRHPPYRARSSGQRRPLPTTKPSKVSVDYTECMEISSDSDQPKGPGRTPKTSSVKWKHISTDATNGKEAPSTGKRVLVRESKEKGSRSTNGSKSREYKGKPLESGLKRTHTALDGSAEKILPMRWRPSAPDASASVEEIASTEKKRTLESKLKETKSRLHNSNPKEKNGKTFESEWKRSHNAPPQARTEEPILTKRRHNTSGESAGKRAFEGKSNEKERMTAEDKWKEKKGRTPERESKQGRGAPDVRVEDILPMKWRLPKENFPFESKSKEKNGRSSAHSAEEIRPLKRKRSQIEDPGVEDIQLPEKKKTADGKLKEKASETPETTKEKKARTTNSESKQKSNGTNAKRKPARRLGTPIRKLKSGYTSEDGNSDVERDAADGPGTSYPTFATEMKHSNVITCFWMGIPSEFCSRHMPDHDQFVVLQDANGLKWEANYLARKKGLSGGWRRFSLDHHLDMGDIVVFELVKPQKFLLHITKGSGVEKTTDTAHRPARETPKKVEKPKHQASTSTKRPPSYESALFSGRKRVNKDAEGKLPSSKKPRLAGEDNQRRKVEERAKRNCLFHSGGSTKKERESASEDTDRHEYTLLSSSGEESEGEEKGREGHRARPSLPKFKHLSSKGDDRKDSNTKKNPSPKLPLTIYEESPVTPSAEPRKAGPTSPKSGPPKKKLRRVSYFYSTDEDQG